MRPLCSVDEYKLLIRDVKARYGQLNTNCNLISSSFKMYATEGRLYQEELDEGAMVFVDEESHFRAYYFLSKEASLTLPHKSVPILVEVLYRGGAEGRSAMALTPWFERAGLAFFRNNLQYELKIDTASWKEPVISKANGFSIVKCEDSGLQSRVINLWESRLDPTDIPASHKRFLSERDTVLCALDHFGQLAGACWWHDQSETLRQTRHIVTVKSFERRGVGSILLNTCVKQAREQGIQRIQTWINNRNIGSIALHEKVGFSYNGRGSVQFILK